MDFLLPLLSQLLPVIAGVVASVTYEYIQRANAKTDAAPSWLKKIIVVVGASVLALIGQKLGVAVPGELSAIDPTAWNLLVANAFAFAFHNLILKDQKPAT